MAQRVNAHVYVGGGPGQPAARTGLAYAASEQRWLMGPVEGAWWRHHAWYAIPLVLSLLILPWMGIWMGWWGGATAPTSLSTPAALPPPLALPAPPLPPPASTAGGPVVAAPVPLSPLVPAMAPVAPTRRALTDEELDEEAWRELQNPPEP